MELYCFDVVVIGAGPAGISTAVLLKKAGYTVCVMDKSSFPRDKPCGGLLTYKAVTQINKIYGADFIEDTIVAKDIRLINIHESKNSVSYLRRKSPYQIIDRFTFDNKAVNHYISCGGQIFFNEKCNQIDYANHSVQLCNGDAVQYQFLVGADGVYSSVRKFVDPSYSPDGLCFVTRAELDRKKYCESEIHLFFKAKTTGYAWIFPRRRDCSVGIISDAVNKKQMSQCFNHFADDLQVTANKEGFHIPFGKPLKTTQKSNVLLVGDAAAFVSPITGEGLYYAFWSAQLAYKYVSIKIQNSHSPISYNMFSYAIRAKIFLLHMLKMIYFNSHSFRRALFRILWNKQD